MNGIAIGDGCWINLSKGAVFVNKDGRIDFDAKGAFNHLNQGQSEQVTFTYTVTDGKGCSDTATATLTVNGEGLPKGSIGNRVWHDADCDGYQDWNESGRANARVDLFRWDGSKTVWMANTNTNSSGNYSFGNLDAGWYYVQVNKSSLGWGWEFTRKDAGSNSQDTIDSDANSNGATDWIWLNQGEHQDRWDVGVYYTPIVVDLNGDGVRTLGVDAGVKFDMDEDGKADSTGWVSGADAFIVHDADGNGLIDDRGEMFGGDYTGDGFRKLMAFDSNGDMIIDASDERFQDLQVWQDANENGVTDAGELGTLADFGLASLDLRFETRVDGAETMDNGNRLLDWSTATKADGTTAALVDVFFAKGDALQSVLGDDTTLDSLLANLGEPAPAPAAAPATPAMTESVDLDAYRTLLGQLEQEPMLVA